MSSHLLLGWAIVAQIAATVLLKHSEGFSRLGPGLASVAGYGICIWLLSRALSDIPLTAVQASASGAGIVGAAVVSWLLYDQRPDTPALIGIGLIVAGGVVISVFSESFRA